MCFSAWEITKYLRDWLFLHVNVLTNCSQVTSQAFLSYVKCRSLCISLIIITVAV